MDCARSVGDLVGLLYRQSSPQQGVVMHFHLDRCGHLFKDVGRFLLLVPEKWVEEFGWANVLAEFAMLEEDVHGFPERVVENLDQFLMDEGIACGRLKCI